MENLEGIQGSWVEVADEVVLEDELHHPVPTLQNLVLALGRARRFAASAQALARGTRRRYHFGHRQLKGMEVFTLAPRMLLARTTHAGAQGRAELLGRAAAFQRGEWLRLLRSARRLRNPARDSPPAGHDEITERKRQQACAKVRRGKLSRARKVLTATELAPGNAATWAAPTDPERRPAPRTEVLQELLQHQPQQPVQLSARAVCALCAQLAAAGRQGLSGMRAEQLK